MAERNTPATKTYICDGCGAEAQDRFPPNWTKLIIKANALDYQGMAVADASVSRDLCAACTGVVHKAVNDAILRARETNDDT